MKLSRHLRRARARWRLHRIEWAAMHRLLEPPPGYEKYHSFEEVFPGFRHKMKKIESWSDFRISVQKAWRLYWHNFVPDAEMEKFEEEMNIEKRERREAAFQNVIKTGEKAAASGVGTVQAAAENIAAGLQDKRPMMERVARDRISVVHNAVHEFAEGYHESLSGERNFWGQVQYNEELVLEDNLPVRYEVEKEGN